MTRFVLLLSILLAPSLSFAQPSETCEPSAPRDGVTDLSSDLAAASSLRVDAIQNESGRRFGKAIDADKDGALSTKELENALRRRDPMRMRLLEKGYGESAVAKVGSAQDLGRLLGEAGSTVGGDLPGISPPYEKLFEGPSSEWVVALGGDDHHADSEKMALDVSQYRGFKNFLERQGFKRVGGASGLDETGFATYVKTITAPDGHPHELTVKVFNSSQFEGAYDEYTKTSDERRGYFSLSHAGEGIGLKIGGNFVRPEAVLKTPAPAILMAAVACKSFDHYAPKIDGYLKNNGIPKEKVTYFGSTQEIEMTQPDGAFAILKASFAAALGQKTAPTVLARSNEAYNPIMSSYDPSFYEADRDRMVMDKEIRAMPVLKGWIGGETVELPAAEAP